MHHNNSENNLRWLAYKYPKHKIALSGNKRVLAMQIAYFLSDSTARKLDGKKSLEKGHLLAIHSPISLPLGCMNALQRQDYGKLPLSAS